jgi:hypothetical protein
MDLSAITRHQWLLTVGVVFLLSSITALALNKRQRDAVLNRLQIHRRRASGASTPPRSFSPSKKASERQHPSDGKEPSPLSSLSPDYVTTFPPSRRCVLPELAGQASLSNKKILISTEPSVEFLLNDPLPTTQSYDLGNNVPKYTPTGFSTAEIKAMGDFPAYDILSGVPLPQPYTNFDPMKAVPRPYRPFRWAYHQTMCKFSLMYPRKVLMSRQH